MIFLYYDVNIIYILDNLNATKNVLQNVHIIRIQYAHLHFHHTISSKLLHLTSWVYNLFDQGFSKFHSKEEELYLLLL